MTLEITKLSKRSYMKIMSKFVEADIKVWTFYPTSWVTNILQILVSVAGSFMFAQLMIAIGHPFGKDYFAFRILAALAGAWLGVSLNSGTKRSEGPIGTGNLK